MNDNKIDILKESSNINFDDSQSVNSQLSTVNYSDDDIKTLDWMEHIRRRPGMYIGKLGYGSYPDDGIWEDD